MKTANDRRSRTRGGVIGLSMGKYAFVGGGVVSMFAGVALAGPEGSHVAAGSASITRNGNTTIIEASHNAILNHSSFNIGRHEAVQFIQPGASSRVLNRISGIAPTQIDGSLTANGIVYIVNPAGVMFGQNSVINVGGIYAAAGNITDANFLGSIDHFTGVKGSVVNDGSINAGVAHFIGKQVVNNGVVLAADAMTMVAGDDVFIGEHHNRIMVKVNTAAGTRAEPVRGTGVSNTGTVRARRVSMSAGDVYSLAISNTGRVAARDIQVAAEGAGKVNVSGTLDASTTDRGEAGGRVEVLGGQVTLDRAMVDASGPAGGGTVLVGGDFQGRGDVPTATTTFVGEGTTIRADATEAGDGGRVIVWADGRTGYAGHISARGTQGGEGGFAEVSGKETLVFRGTADLGSDSGRGGELLLDPQNIVVDDAGVAPLVDAETFAAEQGETVTIAPSTITAVTDTGTAVTLQASQDITVASAIVTDNAGGDGGDLTLQAGRSIFVNANIVTDNGNLTLVANETAANGVIDGDRAAGDAVISQAAGATIDTGTGDLQITLSTGAGLTNMGSGDITIGTVTAADLLVRNEGPTAGSGIVRADTASLITAGSAAFEASGSGGGVGASGSPLRLAVTNVEAASHSGGVFLDSPSQGLNVGGATLGGLTGITTTSEGAISVSAQGGITSSEVISGTGAAALSAKDGINLGANLETVGATSLNTDSDADGVGGLGVDDGATVTTNHNTLSISGFNVNLNATGALDSGTAATTITGTNGATVGLGDAAGDMQISGAELQNISANGLTITSGGAMGVDNVTAANVAGISGTLTLGATGDGATITFLNAPSEFGALTANAADGIDVQVDLTTGGAAGFDADSDADGTGAFTVAAAATLDSTGTAIQIVAGSLAIDPTAVIDSGAGNIVLAPKSASAAIGMEDGAQGFNVTEADLQALSSVGIVFIGQDGGTHSFTIGNDGAIALTGETYDLLLRGSGAVAFANNGITGRDDGIINFVTGGITGLVGAPSVTIGGTMGDVRFNTSGGVTIETDVARLGAGSVAGSLDLINAGAIDLAANTVTGNMTVVAGGAITDSGALAVTGAGSFKTLSNGAAGITLDEAGSEYAALLLDVRNAADDANGTGDISAVETGQMDVSLARTGGNVTLGSTGVMNAANVTGVDVAMESGGAMNIAATTATGTASFIAGGAINDTGTITAAGATTFRTLDDDGSAITLNNTASTFGALTLESRNDADDADRGGAITVFENAAMNLAGVRTTGAATLEAAGAITDSGTLAIGGAATFRTLNNAAGGSAVTLDDASSTFGALTVESRNAANTEDRGGALSVFENAAMNLASARTTGTGSFTSTGAITDSGSLVIGGAASFRTLNDGGANIALDEIGSSFGDLTAQSRNLADNADAAGVLDLRESSTMDVALISTTGSVTLRAPDVNIGVGGISSGSSFVTLRPLDGAATIAINDATGAFSLTAVELGRITTTGLVNLGASGGTGAVAVGSLGAIDLSATTYDLNIRGGATAFSNGLTLADSTTLTLTTGAVTSGAGNDVTIGGAGELILATTGAVGSDANPLATSVASLGASTVGGNLFLSNGATPLALGGALGAGTNSVTITTDAIDVASTITAGAITLQPFTAGTTVGLNDAAGDFNLTGAEMANLITAGVVTIGRAGGTGAVTINSVGGLDLSGEGYDLTVRGGDATFADTLTLADDGVLRLLTGEITSAGAGLDVVIGGDGSLLLDTTGAVGSGVNPLSTSVANLAAETITGGVFVANDAALTLTTMDTIAGVTAGGGATLGVSNAVELSAAAGDLNAETGAAVTGDSVTLSAPAGEIGATGAIETSTATLVASADSGIDISNTGANLSATLTSTTGLARLVTSGDLATGGAWSAGEIDAAATDFAIGHTLTSTGETTIQRSAAGTIGVGAGTGDMVISNAELQQIDAAALTIGGSSTTGIDVAGVVDADTTAIPGLFTLDASGTGGEVAFTGDASSFNSLLATAAADISVGADISTDTGSMTLQGQTVAFNDGRVVTSEGAMNVTAAGGIVGQGDLTLRTLGSGSDLNVNGELEVGGELVLEAGRSLTLAGDVTSMGATQLVADANSNGIGVVTVAGGTTVTTTDNTLNLRGTGLVLNGSLNSGTESTTIGRSAAGTIGVGAASGGMGVSNGELSRITAGSLTIGGANTTAISVDDVALADLVNISGLVRLDAAGAGGIIEFSGAASQFRDLTLNAVDGVNVNATVSALSGGDLVINADTDSSGAGSLTVATGTAVTASDGAMSIQAADLVLDGTINGGTLDLTVTNNNEIALGGSPAPMVDRMTISDVELGRLNVGVLNLGDAAAGGSITVGTVTTGLGTDAPDMVNLNATGDGSGVVFNGDAAFKGLAVRADNGIAVNAGISSEGDLSLNGDFDDADDGLDGIAFLPDAAATAGGLLTLASTTGGITAAGDLTLTAADLALMDPLDAAGFAVTISRSGAGSIGLGDATGDMTISREEFGAITADTLTIGGAMTTLVVVDNVTMANSAGISGLLTLDALADGGRVRFENNASAFNSLEANSDAGIIVGVNLGTLAGGLALDGDADGAADGDTESSDRVTLIANVDVTSAGALSLVAQTGGVLLTGAARTENILTAGGDQSLTLGDVSTLSGADLTLFAQGSISLGEVDLRGGADVGNFAATADANSSTDGATLTVGGTISAGDVALAAGNDGNDTINVNADISAAGAMSISNAEDVRLAAGVGLTAGDDLNIASGVVGITLLGGDGTANAIRGITSGGDDAIVALAPITGAGGTDLTVSSGGNLTLAGVTLSTGDLAVSVDADNRGTHTGTIGAVTARSLTALAFGGNDTMTFNGAITTSGADGVRINSGAVVLGSNITAAAGGVSLQGAIVINTGVTIDTDADGGDITFLGPVDGGNALTLSPGSGAVVFAGPVGGTAALGGITTTSAGSVRFDSTVNVGTAGMTINAGSIRLAGDVASVGPVSLSGPLLLANNLALTASSVTFGSTVNSENSPRSLSVNTTENGIVTFAGVVGGTSPLGTLTTTTVGSGGTTRLNADVFTTEGMFFNNAVVLTADVLLRDLGAAGISFARTINSDATTTPRSLTLLTSNETGTDPFVIDVPTITFGGNIGNTAPLANLRLNFNEATGVNGRAAPVAGATIVGRPLGASGEPIEPGAGFPDFNLTINVTNSFVMGLNEKFSSLGGLAINVSGAGGVARVGDLTSVKGLVVNAPSIVALARRAGPVVGSNGAQATDSGLDFVGETIDFRVTPTIEGEGLPTITFGTATGADDVSGTLSAFSFRKFGDLEPSLLVRDGSVLDLRSAGPTNTNIASTIAGAVPRESQSGDVSQDTTVGQAQQDELTQLGVFARGLGLDELLTFMVGRSIYDDYPDRPNPSEQAGDYKVAVNRLDAFRVAELLRTYDRVFNRDAIDAEGNPVVSSDTGERLRQPRTEDIRESLQLAVQEFRGSGEARREFEPVAFYTFLEESPEHADALAHVNGMREVFRQLALIGLTPQEFNIAKATLLKDVRPGILRPAQLEALVLPTATLALR